MHISLYKESFINFETSSLPLFARISVLMDVVITVSNVFSSVKPKFQTCHSIFAKNAKERICTKSIGQRYLQISSVYKMQQRIWGQGGGDMSPLSYKTPTIFQGSFWNINCNTMFHVKSIIKWEESALLLKADFPLVPTIKVIYVIRHTYYECSERVVLICPFQKVVQKSFVNCESHDSKTTF